MKKMNSECNLWYCKILHRFHRLARIIFYSMDDFYLKEETYKIIGLCMEVHRILGKGHSEVVYKDALEYEFKINSIPFQREKIYEISYKEIILPRKYIADFVVLMK